MCPERTCIYWSGRRDSNPRPQPWQGCALPLSYTRIRRKLLVSQIFRRPGRLGEPSAVTPRKYHGSTRADKSRPGGTIPYPRRSAQGLSADCAPRRHKVTRDNSRASRGLLFGRRAAAQCRAAARQNAGHRRPVAAGWRQRCHFASGHYQSARELPSALFRGKIN